MLIRGPPASFTHNLNSKRKRYIETFRSLPWTPQHLSVFAFRYSFFSKKNSINHPAIILELQLETFKTGDYTDISLLDIVLRKSASNFADSEKGPERDISDSLNRNNSLTDSWASDRRCINWWGPLRGWPCPVGELPGRRCRWDSEMLRGSWRPKGSCKRRLLKKVGKIFVYDGK